MSSLAETFGYLFDIGVDVLSTTLDQATGTILAQLGDVTKGRVDSNTAELWQAPGLASRPALPDAGKASCQALVLKRSSHDIIFAMRDLRSTAIYANLEPGATCLYATGMSQARALLKADGSARMMTTDSNAAGGNVVYEGVSSYYTGIDGQRHLGGEWRVYGPWGGQWQDQTGYHLRTWTGVKIDAGGFSLPAPLSQSVSTYALTAGVITISGLVSLGLNDGSGEAATKALSLQSLMVSFAGDVQTFTSAVSAFAGVVAGYATAIQPTADPTNVATPALLAACSALTGLATSFGATTVGLMATLATAAGAKSTTVT
jgi:hypothetical protein